MSPVFISNAQRLRRGNADLASQQQVAFSTRVLSFSPQARSNMSGSCPYELAMHKRYNHTSVIPVHTPQQMAGQL